MPIPAPPRTHQSRLPQPWVSANPPKNHPRTSPPATRETDSIPRPAIRHPIRLLGSAEPFLLLRDRGVPVYMPGIYRPKTRDVENWLPEFHTLLGMSIHEDEIIDVTPKRLGTAERLFLPEIFRGLGTTLRHAFQNIGRDGKNKDTLWVVQYPEEKRDDRPVVEGGQFKDYFRGVHRLNKDDDDRVRCVACFMCATACPANCIHIVADESPWDDREKYPKQFDIDELRCIYCGMCEEACPCDAIELTPHYEITGLTRQELIFDKTKLLQVYDETIDEKPM